MQKSLNWKTTTFLCSHPLYLYRLAGLVSTETKIKKLVNIYGLIPLGSKAWIAKDESLYNGSIVLLHGNKNESNGIQKYLLLNRVEVIDLKGLLKATQRVTFCK